MFRPPTLVLGEPIAVARGPMGLTYWGPWQFPAIERLADGRLHVSYHVEADSAIAYGLPAGHAVGHAVPADDDQTWQVVPDAPTNDGLLLANGNRLRTVPFRSRPVAGLSLPQPFARTQGCYGTTYHIFHLQDLTDDRRDGWRFSRLRAVTVP